MLTRHCVRSQGYEILAVGDGTFSKLMLDHSMFRTVQVRERGGGGLGGGIHTDILYTYRGCAPSQRRGALYEGHAWDIQYTVHSARHAYTVHSAHAHNRLRPCEAATQARRTIRGALVLEPRQQQVPFNSHRVYS